MEMNKEKNVKKAEQKKTVNNRFRRRREKSVKSLR
jgi:hypothetical protein